MVTTRISYANHDLRALRPHPGRGRAAVVAAPPWGWTAASAPAISHRRWATVALLPARQHRFRGARAVRSAPAPIWRRRPISSIGGRATRVVSLVQKLVPEGTIGVLGLAYKPDTAAADPTRARASKSHRCHGGRRVSRSHRRSRGARFRRPLLGNRAEPVTPEECARNADLIIIATPRPCFREIPRFLSPSIARAAASLSSIAGGSCLQRNSQRMSICSISAATSTEALPAARVIQKIQRPPRNSKVHAVRVRRRQNTLHYRTRP